MRLFSVTTLFSMAGFLPECREIVVIKETPKSYMVEATNASGHRSRIDKGDQSVSFSEVEAWDKYIAKAQQTYATMRRELNTQADNITHAKAQRKIAVDNNVKIGGTD